MTIRLLSLTLMLGSLLTLPLAAQSAPDAEEEDVPGRGVIRISLINGDVSIKRGDSGEVTAAALNAPLVVEDSIFTGANSRAELQLDSSNMIRMAANAEIHLAEIEQRRYIVQLAHGLVTFRVLRQQNADVELSTPSISLRPVQPGVYRVEVHDDGTTEISVRSGVAEIYTPQGTERVQTGRTIVARGSASNPEFRDDTSVPEDGWDQWNDRRDRELQQSTAYRYISPDINGGEDLDNYGSWVNVPQYGNVWSPRVTAGWAPYQLGRWAWVDWYGWTWVSYDPWGWAPYHYGRWFNQPGYGWCWWPGGLHERHWWRPAVVGFFGWGSGGIGFNAGLGFGFGRIGWTPLAPFERFRPWYGSHYYIGFRNNAGLDHSARIVANISVGAMYRNARVANGVSGMDGHDFAGGRGNRIRSFNESDLRGASSIQGRLPVVPDRQSLRFADRPVSQRSASSAGNTRFVSRRQPTAVDRASFADQRRGMEQVTRSTFGSAGSQRGAGVAAGAPGSAAPAVVSNQPGRAADGGGWRRLGDASASGSAPAVAAPPTSEGRNSANSNGWRRVGEPAGAAASPGDSGSATSPAAPPVSGRRGGETGGWRSFGGYGNSPTPAPNAPSGNSGADSTNGWRTFGSVDSGRNPNRSSEAAPAPPPSYGVNQTGYRQFDSSSPAPSSGWRGNSGAAGGGVQVSPPIVRSRGADPGDSQSRGGGRTYQAPPPSHNLAPSYGGGGGRSSSGGSGGGAPSGGGGGGGGRSGGGGGGGRRR